MTRGRDRTVADLPVGFVRKRPQELLDTIDQVLARHEESRRPRPVPAPDPNVRQR